MCASSFGGASPAAVAAWSSARHSSDILSGLKSSVSSFDASGAGRCPSASSIAHPSTCSCCLRFFSTPASAALRLCSGAAW